jgi:hypothetical protein
VLTAGVVGVLVRLRPDLVLRPALSRSSAPAEPSRP